MGQATSRWQLWSADHFDREAEPRAEAEFEALTGGLEALWRRTLEEGVTDTGAPTFTGFTLRSEGASWSIPRDPIHNAELKYLRSRRFETRFYERLAAAHATMPSFGFALLLALPAVLPERVMQVIRPLAMVLSLAAEPAASHDGYRCGKPDAVHLLTLPTDAERWSVSTRNLDSQGTTVRFVVFLEPPAGLRIESDESVAAKTLSDALLEQVPHGTG